MTVLGGFGAAIGWGVVSADARIDDRLSCYRVAAMVASCCANSVAPPVAHLHEEGGGGGLRLACQAVPACSGLAPRVHFSC